MNIFMQLQFILRVKIEVGLLSLVGRHFLEQHREMADDLETVGNVGNVVIYFKFHGLFMQFCDFNENNKSFASAIFLNKV